MITFLHRVGWQLFLLDAVAAVFKRTQYFVRKSLASQLKKKKKKRRREDVWSEPCSFFYSTAWPHWDKQIRLEQTNARHAHTAGCRRMVIHNPRGFVAKKMPLNIHKLMLHLAPVEIQFETPAKSKAPLPSSMKAGQPRAAPSIPQSKTAPPVSKYYLFQSRATSAQLPQCYRCKQQARSIHNTTGKGPSAFPIPHGPEATTSPVAGNPETLQVSLPLVSS